MCTNFISTQQAQWVTLQFGVDLPAGYPAEAYPGFAAPLVVRGRQSGRLACGLARFGLIPAWAKDAGIARHTYNARSETAAEKPSFRKAWRERQFGLVLVDRFFEPSYETGQAVRWQIGLASGAPFGIACLWDRWTGPDGAPVVSFAMLTVNADAHPVMRRFHRPGDEKRTPVVVPPEHHQDWLGAAQADVATLMAWADQPVLEASPAPRGGGAAATPLAPD